MILRSGGIDGSEMRSFRKRCPAARVNHFTYLICCIGVNSEK